MPVLLMPLHAAFHQCADREAILSLGRCGGKTEVLTLMAVTAARQGDYAGLFAPTRCRVADLRSRVERLAGFKGRRNWNDFRFPGGGVLVVDHAGSAADGHPEVYRYGGMEFTFLGLDDADQLTPLELSYLAMRNRGGRETCDRLRLRLTAGSPWDGPGAVWLREHFGVSEEFTRPLLARDRGMPTREILPLSPF